MAPNSMIGRALPSKDDLSASPAAIFTGVSLDGKDATSVNNEDEMEEEAPESNLTTELSLGDLGVLGFGSSSTLTVTKPNPFGVETVGPVSSQFQMPVSRGGCSDQHPSTFSLHYLCSHQLHQPLVSSQVVLAVEVAAWRVSPPGNCSAPYSGFGGSFTGSPSVGFGFAAATTPGGGFAASAASGGGFANVANPGGGGGFAGAATAGGGFAAAATACGGFGALISLHLLVVLELEGLHLISLRR
ncbi:OLC1v1026068C1 [Oldenlandia corymbosa var. corymbosa]|uniref:OLC1v1026068C1 n=1 Tax=Oldenlandia corymbosa var. corymbosa TaxID=529605 RepID=A0AAV1C6Q4_OLDCO|nr:OLC1v1026068C1 [Oldenlandia corymbosa var. corymbosa]